MPSKVLELQRLNNVPIQKKNKFKIIPEKLVYHSTKIVRLNKQVGPVTGLADCFEHLQADTKHRLGKANSQMKGVGTESKTTKASGAPSLDIQKADSYRVGRGAREPC